MRKKSKITIFIAVAMALMVAFCMTGFPASDVYGKSLNDINDKIDKKEEQLEQGQKEEQKLADEISDLEDKISDKEDEIQDLQASISTTKDNIKEVQKDLEEIGDELDDQEDNLGQRLRNMYKSGSVGYVDVLLGSNSISDFLNNVDMVQRIYESDKKLLSSLEDNFDKVKKQKRRLKALKKELTREENKQQEQVEALDSDRVTVAQKKAEKAAGNAKLKEQIEALEQERMSIINSLKEYDGSGDGDYKGGKLGWPVPGYHTISSGYGMRWGAMHYGIDIPAPAGTPVVAAEGGTVIKAEGGSSFGNHVMISHGGGLYTLYAHNTSFNCSVGQRVKRGQTIAFVGATGFATGNHCHFEVYKGGSKWGVNQVNPMLYL
ncbi:MAG: peptidoglycan DD-metalloendopeptidase family protein [Bacillota bacterium]|nr:peptidoglycan DD-metalloendopeptidase family protein [Bacillota bacterium]